MAKNEVADLKEKLAAVEKELSAYKKAKQENDDRFMGERDDARAEAERFKKDHEGACQLVAAMHAAAVGEVRGPDVGPVEDVAALRAKYLALSGTNSTVGVLQEVQDERARQNAKWGVQNHPDGTGPDVGGKGVSKALADNAKSITDREAKEGKLTWRHILMEEVAEAFAESDPKKLRTELVQVSAVATQWVEAIDRRGGA